MQEGLPSRTAMGAASHRAAHQVLERGAVFADPLALRILGADAEPAVREAQADPSRRRLRLFIAARARFAEDALAAALARGTRQLVVLGAGLDTYAYRAPEAGGLRIFEVDHPATQAWKRRRLAEVSIPVPGSLTFAPVDFERETLPGGLAAAGLDPDLQTFFTWLGVAPYLTERAVFSTLAYIAGLRGGAHVVFDYGNPASPGAPGDAYAEGRRELALRVASVGEELRSHFETAELLARLAGLGYRDVEDLGPEQIRTRYFAGRGSPMPDRGGHVLRASTV